MTAGGNSAAGIVARRGVGYLTPRGLPGPIRVTRSLTVIRRGLTGGSFTRYEGRMRIVEGRRLFEVDVG